VSPCTHASSRPPSLLYLPPFPLPPLPSFLPLPSPPLTLSLSISVSKTILLSPSLSGRSIDIDIYIEIEVDVEIGMLIFESRLPSPLRTCPLRPMSESVSVGSLNAVRPRTLSARVSSVVCRPPTAHGDCDGVILTGNEPYDPVQRERERERGEGVRGDGESTRRECMHAYIHACIHAGKKIKRRRWWRRWGRQGEERASVSFSESVSVSVTVCVCVRVSVLCLCLCQCLLLRPTANCRRRDEGRRGAAQVAEVLARRI
jgi:hypothetical protein